MPRNQARTGGFRLDLSFWNRALQQALGTRPRNPKKRTARETQCSDGNAVRFIG